jgi:multidrug resistance efflux pump
MELALKAPFDGVVAAVGARVGEQVAMGAELFLVEATREPTKELGDA